MLAKHLSRPDQVLERQDDQGAQQGRQHPPHGDHRLPSRPTGRARRTTSPTTSRTSRRRGRATSAPARRSPGRLAPVSRTAPASRRQSLPRTAESATSTSSTQSTNHLKYAVDAEQERQVRLADVCEHQGRVQVRDEAEGGRLPLDRQPADHGDSTSSAYPICTYTYVDVAIKSSNAVALKKLINWAILDTRGKGQTYGPALLFVPIPGRRRLVRSRSRLQKIHT